MENLIVIVLIVVFLFILVINNANKGEDDKQQIKFKERKLFGDIRSIPDGIKYGIEQARKIQETAEENSEPDIPIQEFEKQENRKFTICFSEADDSEIIEKLENVESIDEYIKTLIHNDLNR